MNCKEIVEETLGYPSKASIYLLKELSLNDRYYCIANINNIPVKFEYLGGVESEYWNYYFKVSVVKRMREDVTAAQYVTSKGILVREVPLIKDESWL